MDKNLRRLLWRQYRKRFWSLGLISLLIMALSAWADTTTWLYHSKTTVFGPQMHQWLAFDATKLRFGSFSLYSPWLMFAFGLAGLVLMNQDLKDHFNQFLFTSGYRRRQIYWTKLTLGLGGLLGIAVVTTAIQYLIYWLQMPASVTLDLAWPGLITTWLMDLTTSIGFFAICWFAALIIGQTGALWVTLAGFILSLVGIISVNVPGFNLLTAQQGQWTEIGAWIVATIILAVWGAWLYQRLSLEHDGEYLLFPGLRWPVYLVFVIYVTVIFSGGFHVTTAGIIALLVTVIFGYLWLWRPKLTWHRTKN